MKNIIPARHTESGHHVNDHIGAWQDWNLTEKGRKQAFRIGEWLKQSGCGNTWCMFVSPQRRALQTAEEINRRLGIIPVVRKELREVNAGEGNGKSREWYREHAAPRGSDYCGIPRNDDQFPPVHTGRPVRGGPGTFPL